MYFCDFAQAPAALLPEPAAIRKSAIVRLFLTLRRRLRRAAAIFLLEGALVSNFVRISLSALLIVLSLPFLAISFLVAALCAVAVSAFPGVHHQQQTGETCAVKPRMIDQFGFENAVSAYEDLLGAHAWKKS